MIHFIKSTRRGFVLYNILVFFKNIIEISLAKQLKVRLYTNIRECCPYHVRKFYAKKEYIVLKEDINMMEIYFYLKNPLLESAASTFSS